MPTIDSGSGEFYVIEKENRGGTFYRGAAGWFKDIKRAWRFSATADALGVARGRFPVFRVTRKYSY